MRMVKRNRNESRVDSGSIQKILPSGNAQAAPYGYVALSPARPTHVFDTYWRFATERQQIFFRRRLGVTPPWTVDPILQRFKFTNAYRAADRVSQFLLRHVLYEGSDAPHEIFFRAIVFKLFNKISTWQLLQSAFGPLTTEGFDIDRYDRVLCEAMSRGDKIYSGAYIMPSGGRGRSMRKHRTHLELLRQMLDDELPERLVEARTMRECFEKVKAYPMMGDFLAYQYVIDLNYSGIMNFSEMEFVVPGPGARGGLRKCFHSLGGLSEADMIRLVTERQELEFARLGLEFKSLWGRPLQLIDCQNLFCEVDKYARHAHPEVVGLSARTRIKQVFRARNDRIDYWFPPKWGLNQRMAQDEEIVHASI